MALRWRSLFNFCVLCWLTSLQDRHHKHNHHSSPSTTYELPPLHNHLANDALSSFHSPRPRELLPSMMSRSPPGRSTTLPPIQRPRPRKLSVSQNARKPKHERTKSKDYARRMSIEGRKAFSAEPQTAEVMTKRWEELVDAAASVADSDRDLTPVRQGFGSIGCSRTKSNHTQDAS